MVKSKMGNSRGNRTTYMVRDQRRGEGVGELVGVRLVEEN